MSARKDLLCRVCRFPLIREDYFLEALGRFPDEPFLISEPHYYLGQAIHLLELAVCEGLARSCRPCVRQLIGQLAGFRLLSTGAGS